jgi:hypothetical protein
MDECSSTGKTKMKIKFYKEPSGKFFYEELAACPRVGEHVALDGNIYTVKMVIYEPGTNLVVQGSDTHNPIYENKPVNVVITESWAAERSHLPVGFWDAGN